MLSYTSYLLLGSLAQQGVSIPFLIDNGYELSKCNYSFNRNVDNKGQVQSRPNGGIFELGIMGVPTDEIIEWGMKSKIYKDGAIIFCNTEGFVLEKLEFHKTACINLSINYMNTGRAYTSCDIMLSAKTLQIGNVSYKSEWVNL